MENKRPAAAVGGFGIGLIMWLVEVAGVNIPLPYIIGLGCIAMAMVVYGSIPIIRWSISNLRFQSPIKLANENINTKVKHVKPNKLIHDNVLWEDKGYYIGDKLQIKGPLCPHDLTPLGIKSRSGKTESNPETLVCISENLKLYCFECNREYILDKEPKHIYQSLNQARNRLEGKRNRDKQV